jgi:hypothetical protein
LFLQIEEQKQRIDALKADFKTDNRGKWSFDGKRLSTDIGEAFWLFNFKKT